MIDGVLLLWFILSLGSMLFILWDQFTKTPSLRVMTLAWALIALYMGPLGLFIYLLSCRQSMPGTHDQFINVHWKQAVGSLIHCVAGDATAIILMAAILSYFNLPNGTEMILEYIAAYLFGLFIFQALFMRTMYKDYKTAVRKTIFAETVSMNMVMTGMFPIMLIFKSLYPIGSNPEKPYFWGIMSLATIVGFFIAYPINSWMVRKKIKHGMMSKRSDMEKMPQEHHMEAYVLSKGRPYWIVLSTFAILLLVLWVLSFFFSVSFLPHK